MRQLERAPALRFRPYASVVQACHGPCGVGPTHSQLERATGLRCRPYLPAHIMRALKLTCGREARAFASGPRPVGAEVGLISRTKSRAAQNQTGAGPTTAHALTTGAAIGTCCHWPCGVGHKQTIGACHWPCGIGHKQSIGACHWPCGVGHNSQLERATGPAVSAISSQLERATGPAVSAITTQPIGACLWPCGVGHNNTAH